MKNKKAEKLFYTHEEVKHMIYDTPEKLKQFEKEYAEFVEECKREVLEEKIAAQVKKARKRAKISQDNLAKMLHTSKSTISRIENGEQNLTVGYIIKVATVLNMKYEIRIYN